MSSGRIRPGELRCGEPMARYTSWRAGGPARRLYCPNGLEDLCRFLRELPAEEPLYWCGLGSNLLVRDGGIAGTVILTQGGLDGLRFDGERVRAEAGVACGRLARAAVRRNLGRAEFFAGIPGTVGGALAMNAGAWGGETWERLEAVETVDREGTVRYRYPEEYRVGYRTVEGPRDEWFVAGHWHLEPGDGAQLRERIAALLRERNAAQPIGRPSCGSVFRNPPGDHAARLIEAAGLKGSTVGGAHVSTRHANFILNEAGSAADLEALIDRVRGTVEAVHGVRLELEVRIVGQHPAGGAQHDGLE